MAVNQTTASAMNWKTLGLLLLAGTGVAVRGDATVSGKLDQLLQGITELQVRQLQYVKI